MARKIRSVFPCLNSPARFLLVLALMAGCTPEESVGDDDDTQASDSAGGSSGSIASGDADNEDGAGSNGDTKAPSPSDGAGAEPGEPSEGEEEAEEDEGESTGGSDVGATCEVAAITDQLWWNGDTCPSGVCRNLLLRSDGTFQTSTLVLGTSGSVFCDHGVWSAPDVGCESMDLTSCDESIRSAEWVLTDDGLLLGDVNYVRYTFGTDESSFFTGCNVQRLCEGITCSEVLECFATCANGIIDDPACPGACTARIAPEYAAEYDALSICAEQAACEDEACWMEQCAAELQSCR